MNHQLDAPTGIREALPTVFGYIGIGIAFGIVGQAAGFSPLIVSAMSFFIFAGSAQFVTVSMLTGGSPILSIVLATFLVNARMILMGMTIGLLYLQIISDRSMKIALQLIMVLITFGLMSIGLIFIPSNLIVLVVTLIGCGIGVMIKHAFF